MNTGIQDAFNLAWKAALVTKGHAHANLLASYQVEREPVARSVLNLTDRITRLATLRNPIVQGVRDLLLPVISGAGFVSDKAAEQLSEVAISYRQSPFVENVAGGRLRAGDRAPDAGYGMQTVRRTGSSRFFACRDTCCYSFLAAGPMVWIALRLSGRPLKGSFPRRSMLIRIARGEGTHSAELIDLSGTAHFAYDLSGGGVILVRPDGYVAFRDREFDRARLPQLS